MKRKIKSFISILLVAITMFSVCAPITMAADYENDWPIIYVKGAGREIYSKDGKQIMPFTKDPEDQILEHTDALLAAFTSSLLTKNWDTYCDELVNIVSKVYADVVLDKNGEASDGSYIKPNATPKKKTSKFNLSDYIFNYDSRLDPWEVAEDMHSYIKSVLKATGKKKVTIVARCLGANYASAYLARYGASKVDTCVLYVPSTKGTVVCSESFSGKFKFDAELINTYVNEYMTDTDDQMASFIQSIVSITHSLSLLSTGADLVKSVYDQIADNVVPRLLLASYATMPAYWSMVDDDNFEEAKRLIFGNKTDEYAGLIEKIDNYHYNVMNAFDSNMKSLQSKGLKVAVIAKYNTALPPIFESSTKQADGTIELSTLSFGATAADFGKTLSKAYLEEVKWSGAIDYVSNDLIIDASTCLFPDSTWFIKNSPHEDFASSINKLIYEIIRSKKQLTVWDREKYPQFMVYNSNNTLSEVPEAEASGTVDNGNSLLSGFLRIIKNILAWFRNLLGIQA